MTMKFIKIEKAEGAPDVEPVLNTLTEQEAQDINERVEGTGGICHLCEHRAEGDFYACKAFPGGIPVVILAGMWDHRIPYEDEQGDDGGVQFQRK